MRFGTNGNNTAVTIDSEQRLGLGISSPSDYVDEKNNFVLGATTGHTGMTIVSGNTSIGTIQFRGDTSVNNNEGWIDYHQNTQAMRFGTNGLNTALTISSAQKATFAGDVDVTGGLSFDDGTAVTSIDTDISSVSGSDDTLASAKAIKTYVDAQVTAQDLDITTDDGTNTGIDLDSETLTIAGGEGIDTSATGNTVTIAAEEGTAANKGVVIVAGGTGASVTYSSGIATVNVDAAQSGITSLGTLTALTVDDVAVDGKVITMTGSTDDTATITVGTNGTLAITTVDTASDEADITITADGKFELDAAGIVTLDSGNGNFKFEKAGTTVLEFDEENSGDVVMMVATDGKDLIFKDHGEQTNMKILDAAAGINVPGEVQTTKIAYTDGDDAMTVADGGKVTFAAGFDVGSDAAGDMLYHNGTSYVRLAKGAADQVLTMNDAANAPGWEDAAGGGGDTTELHVQTDSSSGSGSAAAIDTDAGVVMCVTASGARYIQLPAVSGNTDRRVFIKDKSGNAATNNITIHTNSTEEIDGDDADLVISTNWASVQLVCDGSKWYII